MVRRGATRPITVYVTKAVFDEIELIRNTRRPLPSQSQIANELIIDGFQGASKLRVNAARRAKREGQA